MASERDLSAAVVVIATALAVSIACPPRSSAQQDPPATIQGQARAGDGDHLLIDGWNIRLFGINAIESHNPLGAETTAVLDALVRNAVIRCDLVDRDQHGHAVARCHRVRDKLDLSAGMVASGWAINADPMTDEFMPLEAEARGAGRGIWRAVPWN